MKGLGRKAGTPLADVETLRDYVEQFDGSVPILFGQLVSGVISAGATTVNIAHTLGRAYKGGFVAGVSDAAAVQVQTPERAAATLDPSRYVRVGAPAALSVDTTVNVWVY